MPARKSEEEVDLPALLSAIRKDAKYKLFKKIVETAESRMTIDKDTKEVLALHGSRTSRKLYTQKKYNPSSIMDAAANDMQVRSRIVEIRIKASHHIETVEKAMEAIQDHVITEYHGEMRAYSNEAQRKALIRRVQRVANTLIIDGKSLLELCDVTVKDIDAASYHLTTMRDLVQHLAEHRGARVI
jgi:hypothetical protein